MELLIEPWSVSVLHQKKWVKHHMHFLVDIIQPKLLEELEVLKHSKTFKTGLVHGLSKDKVCSTVPNQCKNQVKTPNTQPSSIPEVLNFPSHQMFSRKLEKNGLLLFQILIAQVTRLSATSKTAVIMLHQKLNQSVSKWVITFSKLTQNNTYINQAIRNVTLSSINADSQGRTRTYSSLVMLS